MQVSVETISGLNRKMTVNVPEEQISSKINARLQSLSGQVKVDGFRPGKVPQSVIRKRYGTQVREEVLTDLIQSSYTEALREQALTPAGAPQIKANKADEGEGLEYEATFEVMPEFVPVPPDALEVKRFLSEIMEDDIEKMINRLREQQKSWQEVERPSAEGDRVSIAFEGWLGEESFTDGRVDNLPVIIGSGQMVPGFEEKLTGVRAGEQLEFDQPFPDDYPGEKMAGRTGRFQIEVLRVEEGRIPELDDAFIQSFGVTSGSLDEFKADIRGNMEREMQRALKQRTKSSVMDQLFDRNPIELPNALIQDELTNLLKPYHEAARKHKEQFDEASMKGRFEPMARRRVSLALILGKLIEAYQVKADPERVRSAVEDLAASYEQSEDVVRWYYADPSRLREVENMVFEDQVVDMILDKAKTTDVQIGFQDLMAASTNNPAGTSQA